MSARAALILAILLVSAGCVQAPSHGPPGDSVGTVSDVPTETATPVPDRLGWEGGYAPTDPLPINATDGLNESELEATIARTMARVEVLRGLEFERPVPVELISRATYRDRIGGRSSPSATVRDFENGTAEALFLIGEDADAVAVRRENLGATVLGYYSPSRDRIVIVSDSSTPSVSEHVLAHELVHALQYRQFELGTARSTLDGGLARRALIEGDARWLDARFKDRCEADWSCVTPPTSFAGGGGGGAMHFGLYFLSYFPYSEGPRLVKRAHSAGGWEQVNALYETLPASTEQVIHPEKFGNDTPTPVRLRDRSGEAWAAVDPPNRPAVETVGQAALTAMFAYPAFDPRPGVVVSTRYLLNQENDLLDYLNPFEYNISEVTGWEGDSLRVFRHRTGRTGYVWRLVWESSAEATEFAEGYRDLLRYWGATRVNRTARAWRIPEGESAFADAFSVRVRGPVVTIVNAPTVNDLGGVHARAAVEDDDS